MSDALARPYDPFDIEAEYVWVDCDLPRYQGLRVEVRMNLRNRERKRLTDLLTAVDTERKRIAETANTRLAEIKAAQEATDLPELQAGLQTELVELFDTASSSHDANSTRVPAYIAKYVRAWNVMDRDDDGNVIDAPPPGEIGADAFEAIDQIATEWIVGELVKAYRGGKGWSDSSPARDGSAEPPSASTETTSTEPEPESPSANDQALAENSPTPSAST